MTDASELDPAFRVDAEREIRNLTARIAHLADDGDLDVYLEHFAPDASWVRGDDEPFVGHGALRAGAEQRRADAIQGPGTGTRHVLTTQWVQVDDADHARGQAYFLYLRLADDGSAAIAVTGRYEDTFRRIDGRWRMASRRVVVDVN